MYRKYILIFILSFSSTVMAQWLRITSPLDGEYWDLGDMNKIKWEAQGLSGTLEIQYSETGRWNSWKDYKEPTIAEGYASFYIQDEEVVRWLKESGYLFIRIKAMDTSHRHQVKVKVRRDKNTQDLEEHLFLITKNDNIREGAYQTYKWIKDCKYNETYKILKKEGDWYKIKLYAYPYSGYTHKSNGVVVTQDDIDRGVSASDYASRPGQSTSKYTAPQLSGNYWSLACGSGYIGYSSKFTYGYVLNGPLWKINHFLIGTGSISADYRSTYRVGLTFFNSNTSNELWYYYLMFEDFINQDNNKHHNIIDIGWYGGGKYLFNFFNGFEKFGYRHQFANDKIFDEIIHSRLSGFYYETGFFLGKME